MHSFSHSPILITTLHDSFSNLAYWHVAHTPHSPAECRRHGHQVMLPSGTTITIIYGQQSHCLQGKLYLVLLFPILLPQPWKSLLGQATCALWSFSWVLVHWKHYHLALSPNVFVMFCCWDRACLHGGLHWPKTHYLELTSTPCFCTQALETEECATMFGSPPFSICFSFVSGSPGWPTPHYVAEDDQVLGLQVYNTKPAVPPFKPYYYCCLP